MKYLFVNSVYGKRSTGKIIAGECHRLQREGNECVVAYGREAISDPDVREIRIGTPIDYLAHALLTRVRDMQGFCSNRATRNFLKKLEQEKPDVIWLHNIHGYYLNVEMLFSWLKAHPEIKQYWTLHDCWAFTGHCAYFTATKCDKWKSGCYKCAQLRTYPKTWSIDHSRSNYLRKEKAFTGVKSLTLITPSQWLAKLAQQSFLSEYPVRVVHNTVDHEIFCHRPSNFRERYGLENKRIVLGVAVGWEETKGLPDMLALRRVLDDQYVIVLVGTTTNQIKKLPKGVLGISRTDNQIQLAEIYSAADVFVNPTHQDNYPTVNLEARACGTPVITYDVGGSPESAGGKYIVKENDIDGLAEQIYKLTEREAVELSV